MVMNYHQLQQLMQQKGIGPLYFTKVANNIRLLLFQDDYESLKSDLSSMAGLSQVQEGLSSITLVGQSIGPCWGELLTRIVNKGEQHILEIFTSGHHSITCLVKDGECMEMLAILHQAFFGSKS